MNDFEASDPTLKDPVCGTKVGADSLFRTHFDGRDYVFCSRHCQDEFLACPKKYLAPPLLMDLVCGRIVPPESRFRTVYQGQEYVFCSQPCEAEFRGNPEKFTAGLPGYFLCPTHPDIHQEEPGKCPECGLELEVVRPKWVCPYHPEVLHEEPGVCPVYGMPLIPEPPGRFYSCTLHPKVKQAEPGKCPQCGMKLQPRWAPVALLRTEWFCPQHPEIAQAAPGPCPKCSKKLEPREVAVAGRERPRGDDPASHPKGLTGRVCPKCGRVIE
jgi:YHS domain-containing protein